MTATTTETTPIAPLHRAGAAVKGFFTTLVEIIDEAQRLRDETFRRLQMPME